MLGVKFHTSAPGFADGSTNSMAIAAHPQPSIAALVRVIIARVSF
jgi:hypothetical protein